MKTMKTMKKIHPPIPFSPPPIEQEEIQAVIQTLKSGWLTTGPRVREFEKAFADWKGRETIAVNSCTAALHLSLLSAGLGPGDQVITTALTFPATVNAILHTGAQAVLADIDPLTMNIDAREIERKISAQVKAVVVVHFAGRMCEMAEILPLCQAHRLILIEDCAHAVEARQHGRESGTFGDFGCFSFYATKNLTTGEGGAVILKDANKSAPMRALSNHGRMQNTWQTHQHAQLQYDIGCAGYKYNLTDIQASLGLVQLQKLESRYRRRQHIWQLYVDYLKDSPILLPQKLPQKIATSSAAPATAVAPAENRHNRPNRPNGSRHGLHLFTIQIDKKRCGWTRDQVAEKMLSAGIGVGIHYQSIADFPFYQQTLGLAANEYSQARLVAARTLSLPFSPVLTDDQIATVCGVLKEILKEIKWTR